MRTPASLAARRPGIVTVARMPVQITLLGVPSITRDGKPVALDTRKALALTAHLALTDRPCSRELLCDLLWPLRDASQARGALRRTLSTVRGAVGEDHVQTAGDGVALRRGPGLDVDVDRFRALALPDASADDLAAGVELFSGAFLEGFALRDSVEFDDWHSAQADLLSRELSSALRRLVGALAAGGEHARALGYARRWLVLDPLHEPAHRQLIRLHALNGDRAAALEQYRDCVRTLSRELGVSPLQETADLYEQVNDGRLAPPVAAPPVAPEHARPRARQAGTAPSEPPLPGRDRELAALTAAHAAAAGGGQLVVIEGEAGIGKTRLFDELARRARAAGAVVLAARCHGDEAGLPYGPVVELLRDALQHGGDGWSDAVASQRLVDAALLLPELAGLRSDMAAPLPLDGPGARIRLLEAVAAVLTAACDGPAPGIVFLDDVHGADEATIDAIAYLGRRLAGRRLLLVVSWRSEAVAPGHRLRRVVADAVRQGRAAIVSPARLTLDDVSALMRAATGTPDPELERRVHVETEGLPLFLAGVLAARPLGGDSGAAPADPGSVLGVRLASLGAVARQVLGAAAAIGRSFELDTVREASGRGDEELVGALEELLAAGIVRELDGAHYDFSHRQLRELVYAGTSQARTRLLHRRIATALARGAGQRAALVANHLRLAGDDAAAAAAYRDAAEQAAALHAHADALGHLDMAIALGDPDVAAAHERIGDLRTLTGDYAGAVSAFGTAAALTEGARRAAVEHKLGDVHHRRGEWSRAEACFDAALDAAEPGATALRVRIQTDLAHTLQQAGHRDDAAELAQEALALAREASDARGQAQAHNVLGVLARGRGDHAGAAAHVERSLALAIVLRDEPAQAAALNNLALVRRDAGDLDEARELTVRALALCVAAGDRHREAALENNLADIAHAAGDEEAAMTHLKRAVALFADVEADNATRLPEIWKLQSW